MYQQEEQAQVRRREAAKAVQLAMASRWDEAAAVNRSIISLFPNDADAYNRLGRALMELGRNSPAKKAYKKALELDGTNQIAKKNLERIIALGKAGGESETSQVDPDLFIEETGKSTVTLLPNPAREALARLNAGDLLELRPKGTSLIVETLSGESVSELDPKLGLRLVKLIEGGNKYAAAVTSLTGEECKIIIKETYQDPSQTGRLSFPSSGAAKATRPYTKARLIRQERSADEKTEPESAEPTDDGEGTEKSDWDNDSEPQEGHVRLYDAAAAEEAADDEADE